VAAISLSLRGVANPHQLRADAKCNPRQLIQTYRSEVCCFNSTSATPCPLPHLTNAARRRLTAADDRIEATFDQRSC